MRMRGWRGRYVGACGAGLLLLLAPHILGAQCSEQVTNSQWRLAINDGASWLVTPCGARFFSAGINGLDPGQLRPPTHKARTRGSGVPLSAAPEPWTKSTVATLRGWG